MPVFKITSKGHDEKGKNIVRTEYVDSSKNLIFRNSKTDKAVARRFDRYWDGEAKAVAVKKVNVRSRGENWGIKIRKLRSVS